MLVDQASFANARFPFDDGNCRVAITDPVHRFGDLAKLLLPTYKPEHVKNPAIPWLKPEKNLSTTTRLRQTTCVQG